MVKVLEINNLNYHDFKNISLSFESRSFYSIIGGNNSGKTTLFKLIAGFIPSVNAISCDDVLLNSNSVNQYIKKIGIVERVNNNSFIYQSVYDEMTYPLYNLGYSKRKRDYRIKEILNYFDMSNILDKNINELNNDERQILLIILSLLHKPKVLLLDSVLNYFSKDERRRIVDVLKEIMIKDKMTVISFTSDLNDFLDSDYLILLSHFKIAGEYLPNEVYNDDKLFYQNGIEIPFAVDLSNKLKIYELTNQDYCDVKEMVNDIWP